jgi:ELWxxDGT repeat protein
MSARPVSTLITALGNGTAVFQANDGTHGKELWATDGTAAHTSLLMDINNGSTDLPDGHDRDWEWTSVVPGQ